MGNMVTFSVRHDLMKLIQTDRFEDIAELMNTSDTKIKIHLSNPQWIDDFAFLSSLPGIISTQYHHSEDHCDLMVSNQWLTVLPWGFNLFKQRQNNPWAAVYPPELALKATRSLVANIGDLTLKPAHHSLAHNTVRSAYSVFGYKTDYCNDLEHNPEMVAHILQHCRTGQFNRSINSRNFKIESLGTYDADTSLVVTMSQGSFSVIPIRYCPLEISQEDQRFVIDAPGKRQTRVSDQIMHRAILQALAGGLCLDLLPKKTDPKEASSWEPK